MPTYTTSARTAEEFVKHAIEMLETKRGSSARVLARMKLQPIRHKLLREIRHLKDENRLQPLLEAIIDIEQQSNLTDELKSQLLENWLEENYGYMKAVYRNI